MRINREVTRLRGRKITTATPRSAVSIDLEAAETRDSFAPPAAAAQLPGSCATRRKQLQLWSSSWPAAGAAEMEAGGSRRSSIVTMLHRRMSRGG